MTESAHDRIAAEARTLLSAGNLAPDDPAVVGQVVRTLVDAYQRRAHQGLELRFIHPEETIRAITGEITGRGALEDVLAVEGLEEVLMEGGSVTAIANGKMVGWASLAGTTEAACRRVVDRLIQPTGHALNATTPVLDGVQVCVVRGAGHDNETPDHSLCRRGRLAVQIPPVSPRLSVDLRIFGSRHGDLAEMVEGDTLSAAAANFLTLVMRSKGSILIGGETATRKSTLLVALLRRRRPSHIVRLIEEFYELDIDLYPGSRSQMADAAGCRSLAELVRGALRRRADFIVVGEVRGSECWHLGQAATAGAGWLSTIHSDCAEGSLDRLILLSMLAAENLSARLVRDTFARSLKVVVHCERTDDESDYLAQVTEIRTMTAAPLTEDRFSSDPIFTRAALGESMEWTGAMPADRLVARLERLLPASMTFTDLMRSKELLV